MKARLITRFIVTIALGLTLFSSCWPTDQTGFLVVAPVKFVMAPVSSTKTFWVKTSGNWYVEQVGHEDWCTIYPDKGVPGDTQVTLRVTPLPGNEPRMAIFLIKSTTGIEKTLTVEQNNSDAALFYLEFFGNIDPSFNVDPFDVDPIKLLVNTNAPDWIFSVSEGAKKWLFAEKDKDTLVISVADVDRPTGREGTVTVSAGGSITSTLSLRQAGLHDFGAPTRNFTLGIPGVPDSDVAFSYIYTRARITMLLLWGSWCGDCTAFMPEVKKLYDEFSPHGFKIYGAAMEIEGREQEYFDYIAGNGLEDTEGWINRPIFNPVEARKVNAFSRLFYGDALLTGEVMNFVPAFIFVDGGGHVRKVYVNNYRLYENEAAVRSLYYNMKTYLSRQLQCCGG